MGVQKWQGSLRLSTCLSIKTAYILPTIVSHPQQTIHIYGVWILDPDRVLIVFHSSSIYPVNPLMDLKVASTELLQDIANVRFQLVTTLHCSALLSVQSEQLPDDPFHPC